MRDILSRYAPYLAGCRTAICRDLASAPLGRILSEYFEGGKMLRPLLVFVSASAVGGDPAAVVPAAQALELLHGASLIHDDIVDGAKERRGRSALHLQIGIGPAVVLGDYLILRAYTVFGQAKSPRVLEALQVLSQCAEECCRGQVEELSSANGDPEETYFSIVRGKTASQFVAAATVGGILAEGQSEEIEALRTFALNLGIAFQIRDDELDLSREIFQLPTLPLIYFNKHGSKSAQEKYSQITKNGAKPSEVLDLFRAEGVFDRLQAVKELHLNQALKAIKCLPNSSEQDAMTAMAQHAILRTQ